MADSIADATPVDPFFVTIELRGIKHAIQHAFIGRQQELTKHVNEQLDKLITPEKVVELVNKQVQVHLELHLRQVIDAAIREALYETVTEHIQTAVKAAAIKALKKKRR